MNYPLISEYIEAIKSAEDNFEELSCLRPVQGDDGLPVMTSGNFAVVFKMKDGQSGKFYAVKCFTKEQEGRAEAYREIAKELKDVSSPYLVSIRYIENEMFVDNGQTTETEFPVLLMDWVEGQTLDKYIRKIINNKQALHRLANSFKQLAIWLLDQPFAHGDLKPDNILVKQDGSLVLVDYDGMFVPAMAGQRARELGSPNFREPSRTEENFDKDIDTFPIISILLSLELLVENNDYFFKYGAEDRLLFSEKDYRHIENSKIFKIALVSYKDDVSDLAELLNKLLMGVKIDFDTLKSTILGDNWENNLYANDVIEKPSRAFYIIYTIALFLFPFIMRSAGWHLLDISFVMLLANIGLYVILNVADLFRPYKKYHIHVEGEGYVGCIGTIANFVPVLLMTDLVSEHMMNQSKYLSFLNLPSYHDEWYVTLMIWIVWYCSFMIYAQIFDRPYELRLKYFPTARERMEKQKEREKERIRSEMKKEDEQLQNEQKSVQYMMICLFNFYVYDYNRI